MPGVLYLTPDNLLGQCASIASAYRLANTLMMTEVAA